MKFKNKYRTDSVRAAFWDYGWNGLYFITICTREKKYFFGDIVDGVMQLSDAGKIVQKYWAEIPELSIC